MTPDLDALALKLRTGGWRVMFHADAKDHAVWMYVSQLDPRVTLRKTYRRKTGKTEWVFSFGDSAVDVAITAGGPIIEEADVRSFATIEELVAAIVAHDRELGREREWLAAAPGGDAP
ncbi:Uncharacterised protein [Starkeya nomas]|uniref:Uncharacterized protein n=1 Tax=Starkeya nomas TaxID=2666134 RepID=A0A5S9R4N3_9HYPH|nr:hypothetical protein [Starkeya nomas]CAA0130180.1 Uncharacterised protein [Starkeya nomas]